MEELRGRVRKGVRVISDAPRKPAKILLDDINKIQVDPIDRDGICWYEHYPESHHLDRVDED